MEQEINIWLCVTVTEAFWKELEVVGRCKLIRGDDVTNPHLHKALRSYWFQEHLYSGQRRDLKCSRVPVYGLSMYL